MKRFTKMLALGMAMALTFGMTVSATGTEEVPNPSVHTSPAVDTPANIYQYQTNQEARDTISDSAAGKAADLLKDAKVGNYLYTEVEEAFYVYVRQAGDVSYNAGGEYWNADEYGHTWGYALVYFENTRLQENGRAGIVVEKDDLKMGAAHLTLMNRKGEGVYSANLKSGDLACAVVYWEAQRTASWLNGIQPVRKDVKWYTTTPYADDAAPVSAKLYEGLGNTIAKASGRHFVEVGQGNWSELWLEKKGDVYFDLPEVGADEVYIAVSYPYANPWNGRANLNINVPTYYVMDKSNPSGNAGHKLYTASNMNDGTQLVMVFKAKAGVVEESGSGSAPEVNAEPSTGTGTGAQPGQTTGGAVSPKTGEMLPVAVILAAICLAGAAVCAKKARNNA